jgi:hypothetical protein
MAVCLPGWRRLRQLYKEKPIVPYRSQAQAAYFNKNRRKLERRGVNVEEFNQSSKGLKLPERKRPLSEAERKRRKLARRLMEE